MPSYLEKTYYSNIQLGQDVKAQTEIIKNQTQAVVDAQLASTSAVIVSHDRIEEGIDSLAYAVQDVEQGICGLKAAFEWGISVHRFLVQRLALHKLNCLFLLQ